MAAAASRVSSSSQAVRAITSRSRGLSVANGRGEVAGVAAIGRVGCGIGRNGLEAIDEAPEPAVGSETVGERLAGDADQPREGLVRDGVDAPPRDEKRVGDRIGRHVGIGPAQRVGEEGVVVRLPERFESPPRRVVVMSHHLIMSGFARGLHGGCGGFDGSGCAGGGVR